MKVPSFRELSEEQDKIFNLPLDRSYLVTGPPGTGKTVIALHRAGMYARKKQKPLMLSHSRLLTSYSSDASFQIKGDNEADTEVETFHVWFCTLYRQKYSVPAPKFAPYVYKWDEVLSKLLTQPLYYKSDCLLIDEGQDLPPDFYAAAPLMAKCLTVFADENQRIGETQSTLEQIRKRSRIKNEYRLTRNYRNTLEIARVAALFYAGLPTGEPELPTRRGELPVVIGTDTLSSTLDFLVRYENNNPRLDIGVFTRTTALQDKLLAELQKRSTKNPVQFYRSECPDIPRFDAPGIRLVNFQSVKGLEFDAVFIPEIQTVRFDEETPSDKMIFYVLLSRARNSLYLMYSGTEEPPFLSRFPPDCVERRK